MGGDLFGYAAAAAAGALGFGATPGTVERVGVRRRPSSSTTARTAAMAPIAVTTDVKLARIKRKSGRPVGKRQKYQKVLKSLAQPHIERFQYLQPMTAQYGLCPLSYEPAAAGGTNVYPVYAFDLTSVYNMKRQLAAMNNPVYPNLTFPAVLYRLCRTRDAALTTDLANKFFFQPTSNCQGCLPDGSTLTYTWCNERAPRLGLAPQASTHFDWFDIRLMLFGPSSRPINLYVDLVQFDDGKYIEYYGREGFDGVLTGAVTQAEDAYWTGSEDRAREWNEFWSGYVDRLITNPLAKRDAYNLKGMRKIYSDVIRFNPKDTSIADSRGDMKMYHVFRRANRMLRYQWERQRDFSKAGNLANGVGVPPSGVLEGNPNVWDATNPQPGQISTSGADLATDCQPVPAPRARMYLFISAETPAALPFAPADNASFDFCIRRKRTVIGNT